MNSKTKIIFDIDIYSSIIKTALPLAEKYIWIATANIKNLHIPFGKSYASVFFLFDKLLHEGVNIRVLCSGNPSRSFDAQWDQHAAAQNENFELQVCPRNHAKMVIIDGRSAYIGSANFTGAGMGAKNSNARNFEAGIITTDTATINTVSDYFDRIWMGAHCGTCKQKTNCPHPIRE